MIPASSVPIALTWTSLPNNRGYEIWQQDEVIGTLLRPGPTSSDFRAEAGRGKWIFRRSGFLGSGATVFEMQTQQPIATFRSSWRMQGVLSFADGVVFHVECKGMRRPVWSISNKNHETVFELHAHEKIIGNRMIAGISEERLMLLAMFALYRVLQAEEDAASAAIVAVVY